MGDHNSEGHDGGRINRDDAGTLGVIVAGCKGADKSVVSSEASSGVCGAVSGRAFGQRTAQDRLDARGTGATTYVHTDKMGSAIAMSGSNGALTEGPYTYDAYGNGAPATGIPFKFTGQRLDPETGCITIARGIIRRRWGSFCRRIRSGIRMMWI